jgi:hypothetical protein
MNIRLLKKAGLVVSLALIVSAGIGCRLSLEEEDQTTIRDRTYSFDSTTLLESLAQGNGQAPVQWKQADYLFITGAFYRHVLNETPEDSKLRKMSFGFDCSDISLGIQFGNFQFFRTIQRKDRPSRLVQSIFVDAEESTLGLFETEYYPELSQWPFIDLAQVKIPVESALQIAEGQGGAKARKDINGACTIRASFDAGGRYDGWFITYTSLSNKSIRELLWMNIDAQTGEYKILH